MVERHPHDRVAGLDHRHVGGVVGLGAGVRLDVRVLGAEELLRAVDRELLGDVDLLAAAVVAPAGVALGVLVGQHRAGRVEHRLRDEVLGGDHLQGPLLAGELALEHAGDLGIDLGEGGGLEVVGQLGHRLVGYGVTADGSDRGDRAEMAPRRRGRRSRGSSATAASPSSPPTASTGSPATR